MSEVGIGSSRRGFGGHLARSRKENMNAERGKAIGGHCAVVAVSFVLSVAIVTRLPILDGEAIDALFLGLLVVHLFAIVVGVCIPKLTRRSCFIVFSIAFFFAGCTAVERVKELLYLRYNAPYDRFRDNLVDPVPASVQNLRFVPLHESIRPDLAFRFDIDPGDLTRILKQLKMERVEAKSMRNPKDFFQYPYYIPISGEYEFYQGTDEYENVLTIKPNADHSHAIFRKESSNFYRDKGWEGGNLTIRRMENDGLEALRKKHIGGR